MHFTNLQPNWVSAQGASYLTPGCEDVAFATLGYDTGLVANIRVSWLDPRKVREITLVGSSKMVVIDDLSPEPVRIYDKGALMEPAYGSFGEFKLVTRTGDVVAPAISPSEPLKSQCRHFLQALRTGELLLGDSEDGIRVVRLLVAVDASIAENGTMVRIEPGEGASGPE
jgi:predicted dehydrogenase